MFLGRIFFKLIWMGSDSACWMVNVGRHNQYYYWVLPLSIHSVPSSILFWLTENTPLSRFLKIQIIKIIWLVNYMLWHPLSREPLSLEWGFHINVLQNILKNFYWNATVVYCLFICYVAKKHRIHVLFLNVFNYFH